MMTMIMTVISSDTMRAGHYENRKESVDIMIRGSQDVIHDLIGYGVDFAKEDGKLCTQERRRPFQTSNSVS